MKDLLINELGQVDLKNYPLALQLLTLANNENYDVFAFRSCGSGCGDSNCS